MHSSIYPSTFYRVSLKAVITNAAGQVLCVKENGSDWTLPGGGLDHHETIHECLVRELYEEAKIDDQFTEQIIDTEIFWVPTKQSWLLWLVYRVELPEGFSFGVGEDADEVEFLEPSVFKSATHEAGRAIYRLLSTD